MRAAVDIGSNTVRLLIGTVENGRVGVAYQMLVTTRLGDTEVGGRLSVAGRQKTIEAMRLFAAKMAEYGVTEPPVVAATSAVREASDGEDFRAEVKRELGWQLLILSGEQEAACSFSGAASLCEGQAVVIDVGGGSTEMICREYDFDKEYNTDKNAENKSGKVRGKSVKVGAVRLFNGEVARADLKDRLSELLSVLPEDRDGVTYVSVGGTITLIAALLAGISEYTREAVHGRMVTLGELQALYAELLPLSPAERLERYPLMAGREDIIISGIEIYLTLAELTGATEFMASDAGLLDGLLLLQAAERRDSLENK